MKAYLTKRYRFPASHRLHSEAISEEQNRSLYGKCNNPHGHGHNYTVEVTVAGPVDAATGMVCDLAELDAFVTSHLLERFAYSNLNTLPEFAAVVPTTENLCVRIYEALRDGFTAAPVQRVRIEETMMNAFEYAGGKELRR